MNSKPLLLLVLASALPLHTADAAGPTDVHGIILGMYIGDVGQAFGGDCTRLNAGSILCSDREASTISMYAFDYNSRVQSLILNFCSDQPFASVLGTVGERYGVEFHDRSAQEGSKPLADQKLPHWDADTPDATLVLTPFGNCRDGRPAYRLAMDGRIKAAPSGTPKF